MSARYTLSTRPPFSADWRKSTHASLAAALCVAWRRYNREWSVDGITNGGKVVVSSEGMVRAFTRMDDLKREAPERPLGEVSEQVIQEMEIHDDAQERAGAPEGSNDEMPRR